MHGPHPRPAAQARTAENHSSDHKQPAADRGHHSTDRAARSSLATAVLCLCVTLVVGMVSAVNLAIPDLSGSALHPSAGSVLWVVDGYVLVFACLLVPAGALADRYGPRRLLLCGMTVFTGGSVVCALAPTVAVLVAGRMVAGSGAAAVLPTTLTLMVRAVPAHRGRSAVALWASMTGLAAVLGNVGGGTAIEFGGWRTLFVAVVPLAAAAAVLCAAVVSTSPPDPTHPGVGLPGAALLTAGFLALFLGIVSGPQWGWGSVRVLGAFTAAVLLLAAWTVHGLRAATPMLDPRLLVLPRVAVAAVGLAAVFAGMFGLFFLNGQYLQYAKGYSALGAGLRLLPMAAALLVGPRAGLVLRRAVGHRGTVAVGMVVLAGGLSVAASVTAATPYPVYAAAALLTALGCGIATPLLSHALVDALPPARAGVGSGLQSLARELGSALGVAVTGSVVAAVFTARIPDGLRHGAKPPSTVAAALARTDDPALRVGVRSAFTTAMHVGLFTMAALVLLVAAAMLFPGLRRTR